MSADEIPDADGRPLSVDTVLVPVDGSEASESAVEYAAAIADRYDAAVHAVYVLDEEMVRSIESGVIEEEEAAAEARSFIDRASDRIADYDVELSNSTAYGFSTASKTTHPGSVILDTADEIEADFIVVPREPSGDPDEVLSKSAEYVLLYASQPVLSV